MFAWYKDWQKFRRHKKAQYEIMDFAVLREVKKQIPVSHSSLVANETTLRKSYEYEKWVRETFKHDRVLMKRYITWITFYRGDLDKIIARQVANTEGDNKSVSISTIDWNSVEAYRTTLPKYKD